MMDTMIRSGVKIPVLGQEKVGDVMGVLLLHLLEKKENPQFAPQFVETVLQSQKLNAMMENHLIKKAVYQIVPEF